MFPMSAHSRIDTQLDQLYAEVPQLPGCDGRCAAVCCRQPVEQSDREYQRAPIGHIGTSPCQHLDGDRCGVYDRRPMLCRLWGATEELPCPYGCQPDRPPLTAEQEFALFVYSLAVGGGSRVGWPQVFDPERVMGAYRADAGGVRSRFLASRAAARATTSHEAQDQTTPGPDSATSAP